jgi:hypothetical protein
MSGVDISDDELSSSLVRMCMCVSVGQSVCVASVDDSVYVNSPSEYPLD